MMEPEQGRYDIEIDGTKFEGVSVAIDVPGGLHLTLGEAAAQMGLSVAALVRALQTCRMGTIELTGYFASDAFRLLVPISVLCPNSRQQAARFHPLLARAAN